MYMCIYIHILQVYSHKYLYTYDSSWIDSTNGHCPETSALLRKIPGIRTALYSRLGMWINKYIYMYLNIYIGIYVCMYECMD
jgi:hypothetical protein